MSWKDLDFEGFVLYPLVAILAAVFAIAAGPDPWGFFFAVVSVMLVVLTLIDLYKLFTTEIVYP